MKVLKIDHLGIAVNSIDQGKNFWTDVLGLEFEGSETVDEQKVTTAFFPVGESEVFVSLQPTRVEVGQEPDPFVDSDDG